MSVQQQVAQVFALPQNSLALCIAENLAANYAIYMTKIQIKSEKYALLHDYFKAQGLLAA